MNNMENYIEKAKVILTSLLTWLVAIQTALTFVVANGGLDFFPQAIPYVLIVLTGLGTAKTFIRRVTPVPPEERGLLPVEGKEDAYYRP